MQIFYFILFLLGLSIVGYFFGGILFGNVYARIRGENIHELGSKNPGATNVRRLYGRTAGFIVAFLDAIKGYLVVVLSYIIFTYAIVKTIKIGSDTSNL
jgi:glycerol-3-phosphate acyltransferase PlsY